MKVFNERLFEKSEQILEILQLWHQVQQTQLKNPEQHHFQFILNKEAEVDIKGVRAKLSRYLFNNWDYHSLDAGTLIRVPTFQVELNKRSKNLLDEVNNFLNSAALSMGLDSKIDADLTISNGVCTNPVALIKEIILRTTAEALSAKGDQDDTNAVYLSILKEIVVGLSKISWLSKKVSLLTSTETSSEFATHFLGKVDAWISSIECMIEEVKIINLVRNTIESNNTYLEALKKKVQRYLYIRLAMATNQKNPLTSDCLKDWVESSLNHLEDEITTIHPSNSLEFNTNAERGLITVKQKGIELCIVLKEKHKLSEIQIQKIQSLYEALHTITGIIQVTDNIDELTTLMGSLPFILKGIEAEELDRYFNACVKKCIDACQNDDLEDTIIHAVESSNIVPKFSKLPFGNLSNLHITDKITSRIKTTILDLQENCNFFGFHGVVVDTFVAKLEFNVGSKEQLQLPPNPSNNASLDKKNVVVELIPSFTILGALGLERSVFVDVWMEMQNNKDDILWEYIKHEALIFAENKELPHALTRFLSEQTDVKFDALAYHKPFLQLSNICKKLRNDMYANAKVNSNLLAQSDNELLQNLMKEKSPYLKPYSKEIAEYERNKNNSYLMLAECYTTKPFILAYFKYYYIDNPNDLIYIPGTPTSIKVIGEFCGISAHFEDVQDSGIISIDDCNSSKNPTKIIYIDCQKNTATPVAVEPQKAVSSADKNTLPVFSINYHYQDKTGLHDFLFRILENDEISFENKKRVFDYFLTKNNALAEAGITVALQEQKAAQYTLDEFRKKDKNLDAAFLMSGTKYIFESIAQFINPMLLEKPEIKISHALLNRLKNQYNMVIDEYVDEVFLSTLKNSAYLDYPLVHLKNNPLLLLNQQISPDTHKLMAFKASPLIHYVRGEDGQYIGFKENSVPKDGECALNAVEILNRTHLVRTLNDAIKDPENRAFLAKEIAHEYIAISNSGHEHAIDLHPSQKWKELYLKWANSQSELDDLRRFFIDYVVDAGTTEQLLIKLKSTQVYQSLTLDERRQISVLENTIDENKRCFQKLIVLCTEEETCKLYVKQFEKKGVWVGKCALSIYARHSGFNLFIYDKIPTKNGVSFLTFDIERSYVSNREGAQTRRIIFNNRNHFDGLSTQVEPTPLELMQAFQQALKNHLIAATKKVCEPKEGDSLSEFQKIIKERATQYIAKVTMSDEEKEMIEKCNRCILQADELNREMNELNEKWESILSQGEFTHYVNEFKKYQNMLVLVDEPRSTQNETLLYKAIYTKQNTLVEYFVEQKANLLSLNGAEIQVIPEQNAALSKNAAYILGFSDTKIWSLKYYATIIAAEEIINISDVHGLENELAKFNNPVEAIAGVTVRTVIDRFHRSTKHPLTPLMLAAQEIGFSGSNPLFFNLLEKANKMMLEKSEGLEKFTALLHYSETVSPVINVKLQDYSNLQWARTQSTLYSIGKLFRSFFNADLSRARAEELAFAFEYLINGEKAHDYNVMLHRFNKLLGQIQNKSGSVLHKNLYDTVTNAFEWMTDNIEQYHLDFTNYQRSMDVAAKAAREATEQKTSKEIQVIRDELKMEKQESNRKVEGLEKELADDKRQIADAKRETADAKKEAADAKKEAVDAKQEATDAKQEATDAKREAADANRKAADADKKAEDANRKIQEIQLAQNNFMMLVLSNNPELKNSYMKDTSSLNNNNNHANRFYSSANKETESEMLRKQSMRANYRNPSYSSEDESSSDYCPHIEKIDM